MLLKELKYHKQSNNPYTRKDFQPRNFIKTHFLSHSSRTERTAQALSHWQATISWGRISRNAGAREEGKSSDGEIPGRKEMKTQEGKHTYWCYGAPQTASPFFPTTSWLAFLSRTVFLTKISFLFGILYLYNSSLIILSLKQIFNWGGVLINLMAEKDSF